MKLIQSQEQRKIFIILIVLKFLVLNISAKNIVLIIADDLDSVLDGMVNELFFF